MAAYGLVRGAEKPPAEALHLIDHAAPETERVIAQEARQEPPTIRGSAAKPFERPKAGLPLRARFTMLKHLTPDRRKLIRCRLDVRPEPPDAIMTSNWS